MMARVRYTVIFTNFNLSKTVSFWKSFEIQMQFHKTLATLFCAIFSLCLCSFSFFNLTCTPHVRVLNQIYLVTFMCLIVDTSFIFTKKSTIAKFPYLYFSESFISLIIMKCALAEEDLIYVHLQSTKGIMYKELH